MKRGLLFYSKVSKSGVVGCKRRVDREWRQVPRTVQEQEQIVQACHSSVEGRQESLRSLLLVGGHGFFPKCQFPKCQLPECLLPKCQFSECRFPKMSILNKILHIFV